MFALSLVASDSGYGVLVPGMVLLGIGLGLFYSSITTAGVTALNPSRTSLAGGIVYMFQVAGGAIGLGFTTTLFASVSGERIASGASFAGSKLTGSEKSALDGILAGTESARHALSGFKPDMVARITDLVRESFVAGFEAAFRIDAALALTGFLIAALFVSGRVDAHPSPLKLGSERMRRGE